MKGLTFGMVSWGIFEQLINIASGPCVLGGQPGIVLIPQKSGDRHVTSHRVHRANLDLDAEPKVRKNEWGRGFPFFWAQRQRSSNSKSNKCINFYLQKDSKSPTSSL